MPEYVASRAVGLNLWQTLDAAGRRRYLLQLLGVAGVYYGTAKLGLSLASTVPSATAIWPPTGISLAAMLLLGYRMWPAIAVGAFLANTGTGIPIYSTLGITVGNTCEALLGTYLLRLADFRTTFERVRDVIYFVLLAAIVSTTVSATIGASSILAGGEITGHEFGTAWRTWWLGDLGGALIVAPAILVAVTHWPFRRIRERPLEAAIVGLAVIGVALGVFYPSTPRVYLLFPLVTWAALRFWQPGAVACSVLIAAVAIPLTANDHGSFSGFPLDERLQLVQTFTSVAAATGLVVAAVSTERQRIEDTARYISETLQKGLLPTDLPGIPGVETVVDVRPAGEQQLVGGDFYDWFESSDRIWDVVVGDVSGKGPAAARTTALARYTLRAEASRERRPSQVLALLNGAILQQAPGQNCTVAYARLALSRGNGLSMTMSLAGHPPPLTLSSRGVVRRVGQAGTLLGAMPDPKLSDATVELEPGDAVLLYTDGLTDAYAPDRIVTEEQLIASLEGLAGRTAREIASGIQDAVLSGGAGDPRDDIVVMVVRVPSRS
jgi:integral membrane sensor domain MASE1